MCPPRRELSRSHTGTIHELSTVAGAAPPFQYQTITLTGLDQRTLDGPYQENIRFRHYLLYFKVYICIHALDVSEVLLE